MRSPSRIDVLIWTRFLRVRLHPLQRKVPFMNKTRIGTLGFGLVVVAGLLALITASQLEGQAPPEKPRGGSVDEKLNQILERLERKAAHRAERATTRTIIA